MKKDKTNVLKEMDERGDISKIPGVKRKVKQALGYHSNFPTCCKRQIILDGGKTNQDIKKFDSEIGRIQKNYTDIKEETDAFKSYFSKFETLRTKREKKSLEKFSQIEKTFNSLVLKYKAKGYKIPDMTTNKNLFKPSPLLLDNGKIFDYFKYLSCDALKEQKDQVFMDKLNEIMADKFSKGLDQNEHEENLRTNLLNRRASIALIRKFSILQFIDEDKTNWKRQNTILEDENQNLRDMIDANDKKKKKTGKTLILDPHRSGNKSGILEITSNPSEGKLQTLTKEKERELRQPQKLTTALKYHKLAKNKRINTEEPTTRQDYKSNHIKFRELSKLNYSVEESVQNLTLPDAVDSIQKKKSSHLSPPNKHTNISTIPDFKNTLQKKKSSRLSSLANKFTNTTSSTCPSVNSPLNMNTISSVKSVEEQFKNPRELFIENKLNLNDLEKLDIKEFQKLIVDYCKTLNYSKIQTEDILAGKIDPNAVWHMILDLKERVSTINVKDKFKDLYDVSDLDRRNRLTKVSKLDDEITDLKYVLMKRIGLKK